MTLWELSKKHNATIEGLSTDLAPDIRVRLSEMGFVEGEIVKCIKRSSFNGPTVIQMGDCVYSLEQALASSIYLNTSV